MHLLNGQQIDNVMTREGFMQSVEVNGGGRAMSLGSLLSKVPRA